MDMARSASGEAAHAPPAPLSSADSSQLKPRWELLLLFGLLTFSFFGGFFHVSDLDVGYHIRTGAYVLEHHRIPSTNTFSSAVPDQQWLLHQWWPATFYSLVNGWMGPKGLVTVKACIGALLIFIVYSCGRRAGGGVITTLWIATIGLLITRVRFFERPDLFSAVIFAVTLYLDLRFERSRRWQWIGLPALMAFWANTHGGVMYGFVLLCVLAAAEWAESFWKARSTHAGENRMNWKELSVRPVGILIALAAALASLTVINPNGAKVILVPIAQFGSPFWQSVVVEYFAPTWSNARLFYISIGALCILQAITWRHLRLRWLFVGIAFGYLACSSQRSIMYYTLAAVPYAAFMVGKLPSVSFSLRFARWPGILLPVSWAAIVLLVFVPNRSLLFGFGFYPPHYPIEIYRFIDKEVPPQNIFNEARYGGGMLWWLYPRFKPFIDGRGDAYTPEFCQNEYLPIYTARKDWRDRLRKYDLHAVWVPILENRTMPGLAQALFNDPEWALVAFNDHSVLFLERTDVNRETISRNEFRFVSPGDMAFTKITPETLKSAAAEADRALAFAPDSHIARTAAARTKLILGDYGNAAILYGALVEVGAASEAYWRDYGYCLFMAGQYAAAGSVFSTMIQKQFLAPYAYYMRHWIAAKQGKWAQADSFLSEALALEPSNAEFREARTRLDAVLKQSTASR